MLNKYPNVNFKSEYYPAIIKGRKTQTMRIPSSRWDVQVDDIVVANFKGNSRKLLLQITDVGYKSFGSINDDDAKREGFTSKSELINVLKEIYSEYTLMEYNRIYYYRFEVIGELSKVE